MQEDYASANVVLTQATTNLVQYIIKVLSLKSNILKPNSDVSFTIRKSEEVIAKMEEDTAIGFNVFSVLFGLFLIIFVVFTSFYHISRILSGKC